MNILGIDIGGSNTKIGIVDQRGQVLCHHSFPTEAQLPLEHFLTNLKIQVEKLSTPFDLIGVGAPNVNSQTGELVSAVNLKWPDCSLKEKIAQTLDAKVHIENDANIAAIGEKVWGSAKDCQHFAVITLGTGLGTGIYSHGKLITGSNGMASEGGHLIVEPSGRACNCGGMGHLESYVSVKGIKISCFEATQKQLSFAEIKEKFFAGEPTFRKIIDRTAFHLALGLSQIQALFAPEKFILAGGVSSLGEQFRQSVENHLQELSYPAFRNLSKVELTQISLHDGAILGAAALCLVD